MEQGVVHSNDCAEVHQIMDEEHSWLFTCFKCGGSPGRKVPLSVVMFRGNCYADSQSTGAARCQRAAPS